MRVRGRDAQVPVGDLRLGGGPTGYKFSALAQATTDTYSMTINYQSCQI
jgi:hypothetical protein